MATFFEMMFGPGTPEQRRERAIANLKERQRAEVILKAAEPVLKEIRLKMLELTKIGFEDERTIHARRELATLADDINHYLNEPPPADP